MRRTEAVIIPCYQAGWCLADCIESVAKQTRKPTVVMLGCDACVQSLTAAIEIKAEHDSRDRRRKGVLNIEVYYFPAHAYPYRIRNTLAVHACADVLHFFDADDIMYPRHVEMMGAELASDTYATARAEIQREPGGPVAPWDRAHGVVSILRSTLLNAGGWEPWVCAGDTEARERWPRLGLTAVVPQEPTMLVRKHGGSLTVRVDTGYHSELRSAYVAEIKRRSSEQYSSPLFAMHTAPAVRCVPGMAPEDVIAGVPDPQQPPRDSVRRALSEAERRMKRHQQPATDAASAAATAGSSIDPSVSVIVPIWKPTQYTANCLESIARQTESPIEVIIGVDGYTGTVAHLRSVCPDSLRPRVRLLKLLKHGGPGVVKNTCAKEARGERLLFFDADDSMHPDYIATMKYGSDMRQALMIRRQYDHDLGTVISSGAIAINKSDFMQLNGFEPWRCCEDEEFVLRAKQAGIRCEPVSRAIAVWQIHDLAVSQLMDTRQNSPYRNERMAIIEERRSSPARRAMLATEECMTYDV